MESEVSGKAAVGKGLTWPLSSFWFFSRALSRWLPRAMMMSHRVWLSLRYKLGFGVSWLDDGCLRLRNMYLDFEGKIDYRLWY